MSDGIKAALLLRKRFPEHFKTLTTVRHEAEDLLALPDAKIHVYVANDPYVIKYEQQAI